MPLELTPHRSRHWEATGNLRDWGRRLAECISSVDIPKAHFGHWSFQSQVALPGPLSKLIWFSVPRSSQERSCTFTASPQKRTWGAEQLLQQQNGNDFLKPLKRLRRNPGFRLALCWPSPTRHNHPPRGQPDLLPHFFLPAQGSSDQWHSLQLRKEVDKETVVLLSIYCVQTLPWELSTCSLTRGQTSPVLDL